MNCEEAKTLFLSYQDGDLSPEEKGKFEAHLKECAACSADLDAYVQTLNEVSGMFPVDAPKDFTQRVKQTIDKRSRGRFFGEDRSLGMSFAIVSFLLIVLILAAYYYMFAERDIVIFPKTEAGIGRVDTDAGK